MTLPSRAIRVVYSLSSGNSSRHAHEARPIAAGGGSERRARRVRPASVVSGLESGPALGLAAGAVAAAARRRARREAGDGRPRPSLWRLLYDGEGLRPALTRSRAASLASRRRARTIGGPRAWISRSSSSSSRRSTAGRGWKGRAPSTSRRGSTPHSCSSLDARDRGPTAAAASPRRARAGGPRRARRRDRGRRR